MSCTVPPKKRVNKEEDKILGENFSLDFQPTDNYLDFLKINGQQKNLYIFQKMRGHQPVPKSRKVKHPGERGKCEKEREREREIEIERENECG